MAISTTDYVKALNEPCTCKVCTQAREYLVEALITAESALFYAATERETCYTELQIRSALAAVRAAIVRGRKELLP
jgi:queuine/archaeosine tRNA-ribosyltransferase